MNLNLKEFALEIAQNNNFKIGDFLHQGIYYSMDKVRNISFSGKYNDKEAVLKVYNDPRMRDDGAAQNHFNQHNQSKKLIAPEVYKFGRVSLYKGWLIMEKLPSGEFLKSPLPEEKRDEFLELYQEYKKNSSPEPYRSLILIETLSAKRFNSFRINRWLELANQTEAELVLTGKEPILNSETFGRFFELAMSVIEGVYSDFSSLSWCPHSLVRPQKIFKVKNEERYYLLDFCRAGMRPLGYELAVIIWADWLMAIDWRVWYSDLKKGIDDWMKLMFVWRDDLGVGSDFPRIMKASLAERIVGTVLADIVANRDMPEEEKRERLYALVRCFYSLEAQ